MNPIKQIAEYGIPVNSYIAAIHYMSDRSDLDQSQYEGMIKNIVGVDHKFTNQRDAKYTLLYLIQEIIRKSYSTDTFNMGELFTKSFVRAKTFINDNPWHWAEPEDVEKVDAGGKPKRKKGAKQEEALRIYKENVDAGKAKIIELFMSELDMSKAGATTYFYNTKKKVGE